MLKKSVIFDMDGTLMDSGRGLTTCVRKVLLHYGYPEPDEATLRAFVGPPIRVGLIRFGFPEEKLEEAMHLARDTYNAIGKYEADVFPGIVSLLSSLCEEGIPLYVATSKPQDLMEDILGKFGLADYFTLACGADWSVNRDTKDSVLRHLLNHIDPDSSPIMVGDTFFDVEGASVLEIPTIGVSWGMGTVDDLLRAGAVGIADTADDLYRLLHDDSLYCFRK